MLEVGSFLELECVRLANQSLFLLVTRTVGPRRTVAPGEETTHREVWHVFGEVNFSPTEAETLALAAELGLPTPSVHLEKG